MNTLDYVLDNSSKSEVVNLYDLISNVVDRFGAVKSVIEWNLHLDKVNIEANNDEIIISIQNILDNALRHDENEISISLKNENLVDSLMEECREDLMAGEVRTAHLVEVKRAAYYK